MQSKLVRIPAVAAELLRRVRWASILRASIRAEERFCLRSFRGELGVFMWITLGKVHGAHAELADLRRIQHPWTVVAPVADLGISHSFQGRQHKLAIP
jgi:hypothetical protein